MKLEKKGGFTSYITSSFKFLTKISWPPTRLQDSLIINDSGTISVVDFLYRYSCWIECKYNKIVSLKVIFELTAAVFSNSKETLILVTLNLGYFLVWCNKTKVIIGIVYRMDIFVVVVVVFSSYIWTAFSKFCF